MPHLLIAVSKFYEDIAAELVAGAEAALKKARATWNVAEVPGAFEIPAAIRFALETDKYDGYVALGCVIRGETTHYDYVCSESARGLTWLAIEHQACIGNGILTVETAKQAMERAGVKQKNKGADAAHAALTMIKLKKKFQ